MVGISKLLLPKTQLLMAQKCDYNKWKGEGNENMFKLTFGKASKTCTAKLKLSVQKTYLKTKVLQSTPIKKTILHTTKYFKSSWL